jgi:hypothetical protein
MNETARMVDQVMDIDTLKSVRIKEDITATQFMC